MIGRWNQPKLIALIAISLPAVSLPAAEPPAAATPSAALVQRITFDGFAANEVYPVDLDGDGRLELLCLQSPGIYHSKIYEGTKYLAPDDVQEMFCLTAITLEGKVLWQVGQPYLKAVAPESHVADQMVWPLLDGPRRELAVIKKNLLVVLDAATGATLRSTDLGADNFALLRGIRTRSGVRLLVQVSDGGYLPYVYGCPAVIYDAADLRRIAIIDQPTGSGHSPRALDLDGDGDEEILAGFDAYDAAGKLRWTLDGTRRHPTTTYHVDQLQVGRFKDSSAPTVVYAASGDVELATLEGKVWFKKDFGHPQHVVLGNFKVGDKSACIAIFSCRSRLGAAQLEYIEQSKMKVTIGYRTLDNVAFLDSSGAILGLVFPGVIKVHSGEGILVYPQGCSDGSDVIITRDWGWPQALDASGRAVWTFRADPAEPRTEAGTRPQGPGPDGYGIRIADFDRDGRAEILIHDQAGAWIYQPPYPLKGAANTHGLLQPISGQGWHAYADARP